MRQLRIFAPLLAAALLIACAAEPAPLPDHSREKAQISELEQERAILQKQIPELAADLVPAPVCILCFDGAYPSVYENAYPLLQSADFPAVVTVTTDTLPGQEGMMSADQAKELISAGWEFIPAGSAEVAPVSDGKLNPAWIADLDQTLASLQLIGLPGPTGYAFAPDSYNPLADQTLADRNITVALHRWSTGKIQSENLTNYGIELLGREISDGNPAYRIGGAIICAGSSTAQISVQSACKENAVIAVCTGQVKHSVPAPQQSVDCTTTKYRTMLNDIVSYSKSAGLRVMTFSGACLYKQEFESDLEKRQADFEAFRQRAQERVDEIEEAISALMRQMLED